MWRLWLHRWLVIILLLGQPRKCAANFTFAYSAATQCDDFEVSWQGGTGSFQLILLPEFGTPRLLDIAESSFSNNRGTHKTTMVHPTATRILAIMSDSSGFASGGVSPIITVGKQIGDTQCNVTDPGVDFYYENDPGVSQCLPYKYYNYPNAVQPITIKVVTCLRVMTLDLCRLKGAVPGGNSFILKPPNGSQTFEWTADVAAGTVVAMYMEDANGRQGGVTNFMTVGLSDVNKCLDSNSPSPVANAPSMTSVSTPSTTSGQTSSIPSTTTSPVSETTNHTNVGAIAGAVAGGVVALAILGLLVWFCLRRRRRIAVFGDRILGRHTSSEDIDLAKGYADNLPHAVISPYTLYTDNPEPSIATPDSSSRMLNRPRVDVGPSTFPTASSPHIRHPSSSSTGSNDPLWPEASPVTTYNTSAHCPYPYAGASTQFVSQDALGARSGHSLAAGDPSLDSSAARREPAQPGATPTPQRLTRVILHTDLEDDPPPPVEEEIIELPPQYSERRAPPAHIAQAGVAVGNASASGRSSNNKRLSTAKAKR
ncbi:hypothetical protein C8Q80DRAFT_1120164 [Daedaleopsis nitida]|nr:hypothetical protein C8Q80DRAFT_1120164 [Daedaleopsis nitida]